MGTKPLTQQERFLENIFPYECYSLGIMPFENHGPKYQIVNMNDGEKGEASVFSRSMIRSGR